MIEISRRSCAPAEEYHLKAAGRNNWDKLDTVFERIENARAEGLDIRANMYTYTAGATGLNAAMPPWVQEGGHDAWVERLRDPAIRARVLEEIRQPGGTGKACTTRPAARRISCYWDSGAKRLNH